MGHEERKAVANSTELTVKVLCEMEGKGEFEITVVPDWAPAGAMRFLSLVEIGFFDGAALFRPVKDFLVQFGISKDQNLNKRFASKTIADDPKVGVRIEFGTLAFAGSGRDSRSTQLFIALTNDAWPGLGKEPWETPFGYISSAAMNRVFSRLNTNYGDMPPFGNGVDQGKLQRIGYSYLEKNFPDLDYLSYCKILNQDLEDMINYDHRRNEKISFEDEPEITATSSIGVIAIFILFPIAFIAAVIIVRRRSDTKLA